MALITCSGCKQKVSDQAQTCPHCGAPIAIQVALSPAESQGKELIGTPNTKKNMSVGCIAMLVLLAVCGGILALLPPAQWPVWGVPAIDFFHVRDSRAHMTDAQWNEYRSRLIGKQVRWSGYVDEVRPDGEVWIDMDPPSDLFSIQDVYINVPKQDATKYNKDQPMIHFEGKIASITDSLGTLAIRLTDSRVLP